MKLRSIILLNIVVAFNLFSFNLNADHDYTVCDKGCPVDTQDCRNCIFEDCCNKFCCKTGDGGYSFETGNPIK